MKKLAITAVLILVLGTAATAMQGAQSQQKAQSQTFMGTISTVDADAKVLAVRHTGASATEAKTMSFKVDAQTKIEKGSETGAIQLGDLKVGDQVNVTYVVSGSDNVARTISVQAKPTT
jgi:Cu/Ag efflux protein CusF